MKGIIIYMKKTAYRKRNIMLSFFIPIFVLIEVCYWNKIMINGTNSILFSDLSNIYADLLMGYKNEILAGNQVLYNWNFGGGINFLPIITGNLSSIFYIVLYIFPDRYFQEIILGLQLLRIGLAGANMYFYLSYHYKKDDRKMIGIAVAYALSAYMVCFIPHIMWFDSLMLLPLIILLEERLLIGKKWLDIRFIIVLVILYWSNFYIGYMISFFLFLYLFEFVCKDILERRTLFYQILKLILNGVMAAGISSLFLIPTALALIGSGELVDIRMYLRCSFTDILYQMYFGNFDTYLPGGRPLLYCGIFIIILLIVYLKSDLIPKREKIVDFVLLIILLLSIEFAPLYFAWHLFDNPDWFEARFSFVIIFYILLLSYKIIDKSEQIKKRDFIISGFIITIIFYFCTKIYSNLEVYLIITNYIFIMFYTFFGKKLLQGNRKSIIWIFILTIELTLNANITIKDILQVEPAENYLFYNEFLKQNKEVVAALKKEDLGFYRIEKDFYRRENDLVAAGGRGLSQFASFFNTDFNSMLKKLGMASDSKLIRYEGSTILTDAILGIKYIYRQWNNFPVYEHWKDIGNKTIFKNPYAFELGTLVNRDLIDIDINTYENPFILQNEIVQKMYGRLEEVFQNVEEKEKQLINLEEKVREDGKVIYTKIDPQKDAIIELKIKKSQDYLLYTYFPKDCGNVSIWLNNMWISDFLGQTGKILNLENNTNGTEEIVIKILLNEETCVLDRKMFYRLDLVRISEILMSSSFVFVEKFSNTNIKFNTEIKEKQLLLLSIPYDTGWHIYVQGKRVETKPVLQGLIGIELEKGIYQVELRYRPKGIVLGAFLSICFSSILAVYFIQDKYKKIRKRNFK